MNRRGKAKKMLLVMFGVCLALAVSGCGTEEAVRNADGNAVTQESDTQEEVDIRDDAAPSEESGLEESVPEEALTEEELYWREVLAEFEDSDYDLTAALTEPALKDLCGKYFTLGVGINGSTLENQTLNMPEYMAVVRKHFNSCTMTNLMKSAYILDQQGSQQSAQEGDGSPVLSYECIDPTLEWCQANGMRMRGHTLVWHAQAPDWFFRQGYDNEGEYVDRETMLSRMESYICQLMTHVQDNYPGVVYCWDVVNEAVDPDKGDRDSSFLCRMENDGAPNPWYVTIGEDYVEMAFTYARKYAAQDVKLFYNDFNTFQTPKRDAIYNLCQSLKEKGLIDGIGMQGYWGVDYPNDGALELAIRKFAELELELHITELSVGVSEENEKSFTEQGQRYGAIFMLLEKLDKEGGGCADITNVTFFGLIDHYREGDTTNSRLFDSDYQPKLAFTRVKNMLKTVYEQ
ncbi:MAG: endo-1,4-beta-xylanase [bacterium]|nr:endo-1,4-beta-xylanase [bacterium]MCM1374481.1 endo-1,4-beta-xylanase [Muribaculum sp.]